MTVHEGIVRAHWNHRHRLRQSAAEAARGVFNPHHSVRAFRITGPLDLTALDRAWRGLQRRHPVLLTSFGPHHGRDGGDGLWRLTGAEPAGLTRLSAPGGEAGPALRRAAAEPFDVANGPLARLITVRVEGGEGERSGEPAAPTPESLVALVVEHLVTDGWSAGVLLRDLRALYAAEVGAPDGPLPVVEQDFAEFTARQHAYLDSPAGQRLRGLLAGRPAGGSPVPDTPSRASPAASRSGTSATAGSTAPSTRPTTTGCCRSPGPPAPPGSPSSWQPSTPRWPTSPDGGRWPPP